jgi:hypothetical protein
MHAHPLRFTPFRCLLGTFGLLLLALGCEDDEARYIDEEAGAAQPSPGGSNPSGQGGSSNSGSMRDPTPDNGAATGNTTTNESPGMGSTVMMPTDPPVAAVDEGPEVSVSGEINEDTTWTADKVYLLEGTSPVFVVGDHTLTIEPGTTIKGAGLGTALVVTRGSRLIANGSADKPIVFTSGVTAGLRNAGDWGGVVLLGSAPLNFASGAIEGIAADDARGAYGGPAAGEGDATSDCGSLKYVRIEFAGYQYSVDNELNGLTLGGCGSNTVIDYVQVHRGFDDGIEFFGGTVDVKHVVITNSTDDALDWDRGWTGRGQFIIVRTDPSVSDSAIEADNRDGANSALPRSNPTLYNLTLVGDRGTPTPGMVLRRGTYATIYDAIVMGFAGGALDIRNTDSVNGATTGDLTIANSIFFQNGADGVGHADTRDDASATATAAATPDGMDEGPWLAARANQLSVDPQLPDAYNQTAPNFLPPAGSPAATGAVAAPMTDFFVPANYIGALEPGGEDWTQGWTSYPVR